MTFGYGIGLAFAWALVWYDMKDKRRKADAEVARARRELKSVAERAAVIDLIDWIVEGREGWHVELYGSNPDFDCGPLVALEVFGEWRIEQVGPQPGPIWEKEGWCWAYRRFNGSSRLVCLQAAKRAIQLSGV